MQKRMIFIIVCHELVLDGRLVDVISFYLRSKGVDVMLLAVLFHNLLQFMFLIIISLLAYPSKPPFDLLSKPEGG